MFKQTCLYKLEYEYDVCTQLNDNNATRLIEQEIQPYVATILMTINVLSAVIPTILSLFLGPWSDKYGRRKVILGVFLGFNITMAWILIVSYTSENISVNNPWHYMLAQLPLMLSGGYPTLIVIVLCYITDQTEESNRSHRFTIFEIIVFTGVLVAVASSSFILEATSATTVFGISFLCISLGTFIVLFFVEETVKVAHDVGLAKQYKDLFTFDRMRELFETCKQRRPGKHRRILWILTIMLMLTNFTTHGSNTVFYLFVRYKLGWTLQDLTLYEATTMLITVFGAIVGLALLKKLLKFSDLSLSMVSLGSMLIDALIKTAASQSWQFYIASVFSIFKLIAAPMLRSIMATTVTHDEISRIYSITSAVEAISGLGAVPLYTKTYLATLTTFPAAFNLISAGTFATVLVLSIFIERWLKVPIVSNETKVTRL